MTGARTARPFPSFRSGRAPDTASVPPVCLSSEPEPRPPTEGRTARPGTCGPPWKWPCPYYKGQYTMPPAPPNLNTVVVYMPRGGGRSRIRVAVSREASPPRLLRQTTACFSRSPGGLASRTMAFDASVFATLETAPPTVRNSPDAASFNTTAANSTPTTSIQMSTVLFMSCVSSRPRPRSAARSENAVILSRAG